MAFHATFTLFSGSRARWIDCKLVSKASMGAAVSSTLRELSLEEMKRNNGKLRKRLVSIPEKSSCLYSWRKSLWLYRWLHLSRTVECVLFFKVLRLLTLSLQKTHAYESNIHIPFRDQEKKRSNDIIWTLKTSQALSLLLLLSFTWFSLIN